MSEATTPELRFPEFSEDLVYKEVEKSFPFIRNGFVGTATPHYRDKGIPYFQGRNVQSGTLSKQADIFISEEFHQSKSKSQLKSGDMLMVQSGHVGHTAVYECEQEANCHAVLVMTPQEGVVPHWFNYLFQSDIGRHEIYKIKTGNTIEHVLSTDVKKIKLATPPPIEQEKIAAFLSVVDEKLAAVEVQLARWRDYKRGMMEALFSQTLRFKADDGSGFPDWNLKQINKSLQSKSSSISAGSLSAQGEYPVYGADGISGYSSKFDHNVDYISIVKDGAGVGRVQFLPAKSSIVGTSTALLAMPHADMRYFGYFMQQFPFRKFVTGSTIPHIYFRDYGKEKILTPSLPEQQKIADALSAIDAKIEALTARLDATREFKRGLLQKMFV